MTLNRKELCINMVAIGLTSLTAQILYRWLAPTQPLWIILLMYIAVLTVGAIIVSLVHRIRLGSNQNDS